MNESDEHDRNAASCLAEGVAALPAAGAVERRHEQLMEWAETEAGLDRAFAERVSLLAEEEALEPVYALLLIRCGVGVRELEPPDPDQEDLAAQSASPDWVEPGTVVLDDVVLERRLRASFRRFKAQLDAFSSADAAVRAFLAEPDVGFLHLR